MSIISNPHPKLSHSSNDTDRWIDLINCFLLFQHKNAKFLIHFFNIGRHELPFGSFFFRRYFCVCKVNKENDLSEFFFPIFILCLEKFFGRNLRRFGLLSIFPFKFVGNLVKLEKQFYSVKLILIAIFTQK
jgi:hypothetical protein